MERLRSMADGKTQVKMVKEFNRAVFDIIAAVILWNIWSVPWNFARIENFQGRNGHAQYWHN